MEDKFASKEVKEQAKYKAEDDVDIVSDLDIMNNDSEKKGALTPAKSE
jgi:hypothetical protein